MDKNKIKILFLGLILIVGLFLRLYKLPDRMIFDWDQERDANAVKTILIEHKPLLIGPRIMNDSGFMLGPYFFYLLAPFYLLANFQPYAIVAFVGLYFLIFIILSFYTVKKFTNDRTALIFCATWALLPSAINMDTISWNPLLVPLFVVLFLLYLNREPSVRQRYWFIFGLIMGLAINIHVQLTILALWFVLYFINPKELKISLKFFPITIIGFLSSFIPLLIFDLRHNWLNLGLILNFINSTNVQKDIFSFIPVWNNFVNGILGLNFTFLPIVLWLIVGIIFVSFSKNNKIIKSISVIWFVWPIIFVIYGKRPSEYYFNFTLPLMIVAFSILLSKISKKIIVHFIIFLLIASYSIKNRIKNPQQTPFSLANKIAVAKFIKSKVTDQKFNLSYSVPSGYNTGYGYLLYSVDAIPTNNPSDPLIQIVIPPTSTNIVFGGIGVQLPETFLH